MIDEVYGCIRAMIQSKVNKKQRSITVNEMISGMDQDLVPYLPLAINRLKDEWIVNDDETGGKFEINAKLFELSKIRDKPIQIYETEVIRGGSGRRNRRNAKYEKQLKEDAKKFTPIIKKIVMELAQEHAKGDQAEVFQFSSHIVNRKIREQMGDVFDETLAMRTFVAMKQLTKSWILKREIRPTKNIWSVSLKEVEIELNRIEQSKNAGPETIELAPAIGSRKNAKR